MSTAAAPLATAAQRARARVDNRLTAPPPRLRRNPATVRTLTLAIGGRRFAIGANVDGATPWEMTVESAATITIPVRSPDGSLLRALRGEASLQRDGGRVSVDGVSYVLAGVEDDGTGLITLTLEDEVAWRLRQFTSFLRADRASMTRAGFIRLMVDEASRRPRAPIRAFIPEIRDVQPILTPATEEGD